MKSDIPALHCRNEKSCDFPGLVFAEWLGYIRISPLRHYWHLGPDDAYLGGLSCALQDFSSVLASTHQMPVVFPVQSWQPEMSSDVAKGGRLSPCWEWTKPVTPKLASASESPTKHIGHAERIIGRGILKPRGSCFYRAPWWFWCTWIQVWTSMLWIPINLHLLVTLLAPTVIFSECFSAFVSPMS